jgi:predicted ArsR family transcriptional regulator
MASVQARGQPVTSTRQALLTLLKRRGPRSSRDLAARLRVTPTAVRLHLTRLARDGFVAHERFTRGAGRPARLWRIAPAADRLFADGHARLCVQLTRALGSSLSPAGQRRVLAALVREELRRYRPRVPGGGTLAKRLRALAAARSEQGFMAEVRRRPRGAFQLIEHHCPVAAAADAFPSLCAAEARMLRSVLGGVQVTIAESRQAGGPRCVFCVAPRA